MTNPQSKLKRTLNITENGDIGIIAELNTIETRLHSVVSEVDKKASNALKIASETSKTEVFGIPGEKGEDGKDYVLTDSDKEEIASKIEVPIVEKVIEKTKTIIRETPVITEIIKELLPVEIADRINKLKGAIHVSVIKDAVSKKDLENQDKKVLDGMAEVDGRIKAIDQRWRGGGLSSVSHDATLTGNGTPSSPLSVVSSGSGVIILTFTGTIDDLNTTFTTTSLPVEVIVNGLSYIQNGGAITWSYLSGTITLSSPVGSGGSIYGRK